MYKAVKYYKLDNLIEDCLLRGDLDMATHLKTKVKEIIRNFEKLRWKCSLPLYRELAFYMTHMTDIKPLSWWCFTKKYPHLKRKVSCVVAVLLGGQPRGIQRNIDHKICKICYLRAAEDPAHILFKCPALAAKRETTWHRVLASMPLGMSRSLAEMPLQSMTEFILTGMKSESYIEEWDEIYLTIANFVFSMYNHRKDLYDETL